MLIAQNAQRIGNLATRDSDHDFAVLFLGGDNGLAERLGQRIEHAFVAREFRRGMDHSAHRSTVPTRRIFRCNCITP